MPTDWRDISEDEILNFDEAHTGKMAKYERIMRNKTNTVLMEVRTGLHDAKEATIQSSEKIESALREAERSSGKFQKATIALTIVIAFATIFYTAVTWQAVQVDKEANQIQREMLEFQRSVVPASSNKPLKATPKSGAP